MSIEAIIALVLGLSTGILGWKQWQSAAPMQKADATSKIGDTYAQLLDQLREQIDDVEAKSEKRIKDMDDRISYLESELKRYTNWSARLVRQLAENGIDPVKIDTGPLKMKAEEAKK